MECLPFSLDHEKIICLTTTEQYLPINAWKSNDAYFSWSSQRVPSNPIGQYFLFIFLSLAVWLCLKKFSENRVLVVLLQIGAKDLTVWYQTFLKFGGLYNFCLLSGASQENATKQLCVLRLEVCLLQA